MLELPQSRSSDLKKEQQLSCCQLDFIAHIHGSYLKTRRSHFPTASEDWASQQ